MEDTIKRNASVREPERDVIGSDSSLNSIGGSDDSGPILSAARRPTGLTKEYKYTVTHKGATVSLTCPNMEIIKKSKIILEMFLPKADDFSWLEEKIRNESGIGLELNNTDDITSSPPSSTNRESSERETITTPTAVPVSPSSPIARSTPLLPAAVTQAKRIITREYSRQFLLDISSDRCAWEKPPGWEYIFANCQDILRTAENTPSSHDAAILLEDSAEDLEIYVVHCPLDMNPNHLRNIPVKDITGDRSTLYKLKLPNSTTSFFTAYVANRSESTLNVACPSVAGPKGCTSKLGEYKDFGSILIVEDVNTEPQSSEETNSILENHKKPKREMSDELPNCVTPLTTVSTKKRRRVDSDRLSTDLNESYVVSGRVRLNFG